ncbi:MAG: PKD domain-containing protein, partial [Candidatus Thermoplasmatota archaeon]
GLVIASSQQKIGSASVIVVEKDTDVPKAIIDTVSPNPAKEEQVVYFYGHGDSIKKIIGYKWSSSIDGILSDEASFSSSKLSLGNHTISFLVQDDSGVWSEPVSIKLEIIKKVVNRAPVVGEIELLSKKINVGEKIEIKTFGSVDYDGDVLQFLFCFGDRTKSGWIDNDNISHAYAKPGKYKLKFKVRDSKGAESNWSSGVELEVVKKISVTEGDIWFVVLLLAISISLGAADYVLWRRKKHS